MKPIEADAIVKSSKNHQKSIFFAEGLPAFETHNHFLLIWNEEEAPFIWLQSQSSAQLAFITIDPFLINSDYLPDIPDEDVEALKIADQKDVFILSIVNIRNNPKLVVTANLLSPIVINWKEQLGKQVILNNHQLYSVRHPIPQAFET